jgi:hypothetical protein
VKLCDTADNLRKSRAQVQEAMGAGNESVDRTCRELLLIPTLSPEIFIASRGFERGRIPSPCARLSLQLRTGDGESQLCLGDVHVSE